MKVLLVNGSPHAKGCTYTALNAVKEQLAKQDIESVFLQLGTKPLQDCIACNKCVKTGYCVFKDDCVNEGIDLFKECDGVIVGSPVYYSGPSARLCAFLDRVCYCKAKPYAGKPAAAVVSCRRSGSTASFERLNQFFAMNRMPIVTSQYWNAVHGNTPEEVLQDTEGLQTMRTLADNMAWLLRCIEAGKAAGIRYPEIEAWTPTNFIR